MTSVPPTNNDDSDETPQPADSPSTESSPATSSFDAGTTPAGAADRETTIGATQDATSADDAADSGAPFGAAGEPSSAQGPGGEPATEAATGEEETGETTTAPSGPAATAGAGAGYSAAPSGEEPATRRLPTEEEDEALRAERERRFGRVAGEPPAEQTAAEPATATAPAEPDPLSTEPQTTAMAPPPPPQEEEDPFADFDDGPTSRAAAHWWGILIAIVFGPVTWYLIADGGERVSYALSQNIEAVNILGLVELAGGLITLIIMLLAARWSSVGSIIIGSIGALIGAAFLIVPSQLADFLSSQSMFFDRLGQFGANLFDRLTADGHSGRLLAYGISFIFIGVVSHGARRQGRREERRKAVLGE